MGCNEASGSVGHRHIDGWTHIYSGKVRDVYCPSSPDTHSGTDSLLIVASDRISAYGVVLPTQIPDKGAILNLMSLWWFERLSDTVENHVLSTNVPAECAGRAMITQRLNMFPIVCGVRGYLGGTAFASYEATGSVSGIALPDGLVRASQLESPIFTPAIKAKSGVPDTVIDFAQTQERVGSIAHDLRYTSMVLYQRAHEIALDRGIIIADTKFEFGTSTDPGKDQIVLADELLTPDSARFWYADRHTPGERQQSMDKQFVRDWLTTEVPEWDPASGLEPPELPDVVVAKTRDRYIEAYETLTGRHWQ